MPWDPSFIADCLPITGGGVRPVRYLLESESVPEGSPPFGGTLALSSWYLPGYAPLIAERGHSVSYGELNVRDWTCSRGTLTIALVWTSLADDQRANMKRGQLVALRIGFSDDPAEFEPVFRGRIRSLDFAGGTWRLNIEEITGALTSRFDQTNAGLFHDLASTTVTGGAVDGHTVLPVVSTASFRDDGGTLGAVLVSGASGDFVDTYDPSLTAAAQFNGVTAGALGTDPGSTVVTAGATVQELALFVGHPITIALRILHSTGDGTNGAYDVAPESWGYALPRDLVDEEDAQTFRSYVVPSGGATQWQVYSATEQGNGLSWMTSWLQQGGMFLTMRQGQITVRAAILPWQHQTPGHIDISPETGLQSVEYNAYDPSCPMEYCFVEMLRPFEGYTVVGGTEDVENMPNAGALERPADFAGVIDTSESEDWREEIMQRIRFWDHRTPERVVCTMAGWWAGQAAPGDTCTLDATRFGLRDRYGRDFDGLRRGIVVSAQPNWFGATTRVVAVFLPYDSDVGV